MASEQHDLLRVSASPHVFDSATVDRIMLDVIIALLPALGWAIWRFGLRALWVTLASVAGSVLSEFVFEKLTGKDITIDDMSAVVTGMLMAFTITPLAPLWLAFIGGVLAIALGKQLFGGLGYNVFNPALVGRAILLASWPLEMTTYRFSDQMIAKLSAAGKFVPDAVTMATPLTAVKGSAAAMQFYSHFDLFLGNIGGSIGEVSALCILIGGIYLLYRKLITWRTPVFYIGTVGVLSLILGRDPVFQMFAGGLFLGAFFMATDMVTTPITNPGKIIFACGAGLLVVLIRNFGAFPEGVCYSILIMNILTPLIDKFIKPRGFGRVVKKS